MDAITDHGPGGSAKWGDAVRAGFQQVPDALLMKQAELGLDQTDMVVLLNLTSYWWFRDLPPFPRTNVIAKRMGVTPRTVQRSMSKLQKKGLIRRDDYVTPDGATMPAVYFEGLINTLSRAARSDARLALRMELDSTANEVLGAPPQVPTEADEIPF
jgi:hypothetical protein